MIQVEWQAVATTLSRLPWLYIVGVVLAVALLAGLAGNALRNLLPVLALLFVLYLLVRGLGFSPGELVSRLDALFRGP